MKRFLVFLFSCVFLSTSHAFEKFVIRDIRLEGLKRIEIGTVFNYLPVKVGDTFTEQLSGRAIRALYKTGFFKDVAGP